MFKLHGCDQMQAFKCGLVATFLWLALFVTAWLVVSQGAY